jgi:hypothetical protein
MYRLLRDTHLACGLFAVLFVLMYGVSSVQMAHNSWFDVRPAVTESRYNLPAKMEGARAAARELMDRHGLAGELGQVKETPEGASFRIVRPGIVHEIVYTAASGETAVRTSKANFAGLMNRLHHISGLWHEDALVNAWAAALALIAASLIVLGLSGIYLWFKIHTERLMGSVLLAVSLAFSITVIVLLRTA